MNMKNIYKNRFKLQRYIIKNAKKLKPVSLSEELVPVNTSTPNKVNHLKQEQFSIDISPIEDCGHYLSFENSTEKILQDIEPVTPDTPMSYLQNENSSIAIRREKVKKNLTSLMIYSPRHNPVLSKAAVDITIDEEDVPDCIIKLDKTKATFSGKVVPPGSKNALSKTWLRPLYSKCKYLEGSFYVTSEELKSITKDRKLEPGCYQYVLKKKFKNVNNTCVLNFKQSRYISLTDSFKIYAYCAHNCKKFIIVLKNITSNLNSYAADVYSSSLHYNHWGKITRFLKGKERALMRNKLKLNKPSAIRRTDILNASP